VTIVEGSTFAEMRAALGGAPELRKDSANMSDAELFARGRRGRNAPEGLFARKPTSSIPGRATRGAAAGPIVAQRAIVQQAWEGRSRVAVSHRLRGAHHGVDRREENRRGGDRSRIAGVFVNRLQRELLLQTDPTVIYGMGAKFDGNLRKRDLTTDSPYNTYMRAGLPPTPIALPGALRLQRR